MVRDYEAVFITSADLNSEEQAELLDRVRGFVARFEGQICREYFWGRRKLAYPIKKKDYGIYHLWYLSGDGAMLEELERQFGYSEQVIRAQIIKVEDWESAAAKFESLVELKPAEEASNEGEDKEDDDSDAVETETNPLKPTKTKTPIRNERWPRKRKNARCAVSPIASFYVVNAKFVLSRKLASKRLITRIWNC